MSRQMSQVNRSGQAIRTDI